MEEKHDIVAPVFKAKGKPVSKAKISSQPVVKRKAGNIQLTIFKGTNPSLAAEIVKAVVRYAHYSLFLFCGSRNDRFKGLLWDGEGFILLYKRFENGHLSWPRHSSEAKELSARQLDWLLKGLNPLPVRRIKAAQPGTLY